MWAFLVIGTFSEQTSCGAGGRMSRTRMATRSSAEGADCVGASAGDLVMRIATRPVCACVRFRMRTGLSGGLESRSRRSPKESRVEDVLCALRGQGIKSCSRPLLQMCLRRLLRRAQSQPGGHRIRCCGTWPGSGRQGPESLRIGVSLRGVVRNVVPSASRIETNLAMALPGSLPE